MCNGKCTCGKHFNEAGQKPEQQDDKQKPAPKKDKGAEKKDKPPRQP